MTPKTKTLLAILCLLALATHASEVETAVDQEFETATFSMYCYWTGEATLGNVDGVMASRIGHWGGQEIVQVDYDPQRTDVTELTAILKRQRSFYSRLVSTQGESDGEVKVQNGKPRFIEPKHSLRTRHPELHALGLTEQQAIALNSWSYFGGEMPDVLTEEQQQQLLRR